MTFARPAQVSALTIAVAATMASAPLAQQAPTFAGGTAAVVIDALVTRNGTPVTDLSADDFEVRDAGVLQRVQLMGIEKVPVALLLVLDTSASVRGPALGSLKGAAKAAVNSLRPGDQAALMTFSQNVAMPVGWTSDARRLSTAIDAATAQGSTSLADAAFAALCQQPPQLARTLVLVFTDGDDSSSWLDAASVASVARRTDAVVYGVTLATSGSRTAVAAMSDDWRKALFQEPALLRGTLLPLLADETGGEFLVRADTADLSATFLSVLARFNQRYVLTFPTTHAPGSGWHPVDVRVKDAALMMTARRGYTR